MDHKKFPPSLDTKPKRIAKACRLVDEQLNLETTGGELASFQGMWSETYIISVKDEDKVVVQFRAEPLDIAPFERAYQLLGSYCPVVKHLHDKELEDAGFYPVHMNLIEGHTWCDDPQQDHPKKGPAFNVKVMKSLGTLLARCITDAENANANAFQEEVIDKLDKRLNSKREEIDPFHDVIRQLKNDALTYELWNLPLFQSHMDLNDMNIMVTDNGKVTGIIDWELSPQPQPFGMGLHRVHSLACICENRVFRQRKEYDEMEQGFWTGLLDALPAKHKHTIEQNPMAVQTAFTIGTILWCFDFDTGGEYINPAILAALPWFLTYRIPAIRGGDPPYSDPPCSGTSSRRRELD